MGVAQSSASVQDLSPGITPTSQNWITSHAKKAGLSIPEVQRLWDQFRHLGASSVTGRLNPAISAGSRLNYNSHMFINSLPKAGGNISFLNYCIACSDIENSTEEEKLRVLRKLVQSVYPRENDDVIKSTTDTLLSQFTYGSHDYVTEMDFLRFMRNFDDHTLIENCLSYEIIPPYLKNQKRDDDLSDYNPTARSGQRLLNNRNNLEEGEGGVGSLPSDQQLKTVSQLMSEPQRDWGRLLNTLGFTEGEIKDGERENGNDTYDTVLAMLTRWRDSEPGTTLELKQALEETNNADISNRL